jgi:hypothetical protein
MTKEIRWTPPDSSLSYLLAPGSINPNAALDPRPGRILNVIDRKTAGMPWPQLIPGTAAIPTWRDGAWLCIPITIPAGAGCSRNLPIQIHGEADPYRFAVLVFKCAGRSEFP